jgi:hypothetical protein
MLTGLAGLFDSIPRCNRGRYLYAGINDKRGVDGVMDESTLSTSDP